LQATVAGDGADHIGAPTAGGATVRVVPAAFVAASELYAAFASWAGSLALPGAPLGNAFATLVADLAAVAGAALPPGARAQSITDLARAAPPLTGISLRVAGLTRRAVKIAAVPWRSRHRWADSTCWAAVEPPVVGLAATFPLAAGDALVEALKRPCVAITKGTARAAISAWHLALWAAYYRRLSGLGGHRPERWRTALDREGGLSR